ncbi:hypothetical protein Ddye_001543 [Dipteronia dyeriana]|uniref:Agenet domain-containing protein n=1 Tax=Dipteronia dyeriana TaxID=168575 RepID=A0AAD9XNQ1_9ROSI|nr:hypothetical protein Ddye_001543 [Dipteronia dyeriana]
MHNDQKFQVNDVVDGYYNDGWWVGVVCNVWGDSKAYTVVFDDPLDLIKFSSSLVRVHLDWVDGKWVQPPKRVLDSFVLIYFRPLNHHHVCSSAYSYSCASKECDGIEGAVDDIIVEDCTTDGLELAIIGEPTEFTDSSAEAEDTEMAIVPSNMVYADEHLSISLQQLGLTQVITLVFPVQVSVIGLSTCQVRVRGDYMTLLCNMIQGKPRLTICNTRIKAFNCLKDVHHQYGVAFNLSKYSD